MILITLKLRLDHFKQNGICEHFKKTMLQEFYQVTFCRKLYSVIDELQKNLDEWLEYFNNRQTHQDKMCCGRAPMDTLEDGKKFWKEKHDRLNLI